MSHVIVGKCRAAKGYTLRSRSVQQVPKLWPSSSGCARAWSAPVTTRARWPSPTT